MSLPAMNMRNNENICDSPDQCEELGQLDPARYFNYSQPLLDSSLYVSVKGTVVSFVLS